MIYSAYQTATNMSDPVRLFAQHALAMMENWQLSDSAPPLRKMTAYYEQITLTGLTHVRPAFKIEPVTSADGKTVSVNESLEISTDFCQLVKFRKSNSANLPKILLVAPMSGHFATLAGEALVLYLSGAIQVGGNLLYILV
jgi:poly-beta-hydroxyalkanoate depolymerase